MTVKIVQNSKVTLKPFKFDIDYSIVPYIRNCPFQHGIVQAEFLEVVLFNGKEPFTNLILDKDKEYIARIKGAQSWFSQATGKTNIVIILDSPDLEIRHAELAQLNKNVLENFVPHIVLVYDVPGFTQDTRWWVNEIIDKFNEGPLSKYYGNTIRLAYESLSEGVLFDSDSETQLITNPI